MPRPSKTPPTRQDKRILIDAIVAQISRDLQGIMASAKASHAEATHEQNKPENKYDTRALEASYLARGQSRQVAELEIARQEYESLTVDDFLPETPLDVGALVTLERTRDGAACYFLGPKAGGTEVLFAGAPVTVITPQSPLGRQLVGRKQGEVITLQGQPHRIVQVR